uniref:RNA-dependent RNA polymerase n=1 Tax=Nanning Parti tick virus 1 TaxID=2972266 RepID=A0A9E7V264_9VIRU|nr:MAG: RNA-dependent RNA polymerase [Nanning Parti tick virus 1]
MPYFKRLPSDEGFPFNLVPARRDQLAYRTARNHFGERVDSILTVLHRSELTYEALMSDFFEYDRQHANSIRGDPVYQMALQSVRDQFKRVTPIIPLTTGAVTKGPDFPGAKSPGLPWKLKGYRTKRDVADDPEAMSAVRKAWYRIGAGAHVSLPDVSLYARAQIAKVGETKIRATWGYPFDVYVEEGRFFYPLMEWLKDGDHDIPIAYGFEMATGGMRAIHNMLCRSHNRAQYMMTDWSRFDKTIPPWLIKDAFSVLEDLFDFGHVRDSEGLIWHVRAYRSKRRWDRMVNYFVNTPVRTCKGERFLVSGGVPSGSCFTNIIDTIINMLVTRYCMYQTTGGYPIDEMYLGDDGVLVVPNIVNIDDIAALALDKFGMVLNTKKTYLTGLLDNCHFLGYFNHAGVPFKNQDFLIASFIEPEHTRRTAVEAAAAALGQLWSTFDPYYAYVWYKIILDICDDYSIPHPEVQEHLIAFRFRHKYLQSVGIDIRKLSFPTPAESMIYQVMPPSAPRKLIPHHVFDYDAIWHRAWHRWRRDEAAAGAFPGVLHPLLQADEADMAANPHELE